MKSLTHAIVGVTSGVAAFVVLDLLRQQGVEMPAIEWSRSALVERFTAARSGEAPGGAVDVVAEGAAMDRTAPLATAVALDHGSGSNVGAGAPRSSSLTEARPDADRSSAIDLEGVAVEQVSEARESDAASPAPRRSPATPGASESSPSDLARAGERAKALAAAMERLGKRLDGTANRRFPR